MRILWASNSPTSPSGYGVQTDLFVRRLVKAGHDVAIASNYGHQEGMLSWNTGDGEVPIYPQSGDRFSLDILPHHAMQHNADVVLSHYDSWVYRPEQLAGRWVPWYPMDCENYPEPITRNVAQALMPITQTRHSVAEAAKVGIEAEYVPAGFDSSEYYPRGRKEWREANDCVDNYVVGTVAANRGDPGAPSRKSYPQIFDAFGEFLKVQPNAKLYIHAHMDGHQPLGKLAEQYGVPHEALLKAHPYFLHTGLYKPHDMALMYSGIDVLLSPSMGEGFGVPIVEAQACGTPVIVGDWTAMSEVAKSGVKIAKEDAYRYPVVGYGDMWLPNPSAILDALVESVTWPRSEDVRAKISKRVQEYEVNTVWASNWLPTLRKLEERVSARPKSGTVPDEDKRRTSRRLVMADEEAVAV